MLKEQGLRIDSIPEKGQQVFLRENSNVSTGGDSIDVTDDIHESYKQLAVDAVEVLGASISGIDLIILIRTSHMRHTRIMELSKQISIR